MTYFFPRFKERDCGEILLASPEMHNIPRTCSSKALSTFLTLDIQVLLLSTVTTAGSNVPMDHYISYMQRQLSTFPWHSVLYPKPFNTFQLSPVTMPSALLTSLMGVLRTFSGPQLCWSIKPKPDQESLPEALLMWKDVTSYMSNSSTYISAHYSPKSIFFLSGFVGWFSFFQCNYITDMWFVIQCRIAPAPAVPSAPVPLMIPTSMSYPALTSPEPLLIYFRLFLQYVKIS